MSARTPPRRVHWPLYRRPRQRPVMPLIRLDRTGELLSQLKPAGRPAPGEQQAVEQPDGATAQHDYHQNQRKINIHNAN